MQPNLQDMLTLERMDFTDKSTIGEIRLDGDLFCFSLEDTCRAKGIKIPGETAIPAGKYEVIINESTRFKRPMPLLLSVPGYEGVRIHSGNTDKQTIGCILVGTRKGPDFIYDSKTAFEKLFIEIQKRLLKGKLYIAVIGGRQEASHA